MKKIFTLALAAVAAFSVNAVALAPGYLAGEIGNLAGTDKDTWALDGAHNNWTPASAIEIAQIEEGVYEGEFWLVGYFAFSTEKGDWDVFNPARWQAADGVQALVSGEPKEIVPFFVDQNAAFNLPTPNTAVKIKIDTNYGEMTVTDLINGSEIIYPDPAITGSAWGWGVDDDTQKFVQKDGVWETTFTAPVALTVSDMIKVCGADGSWSPVNFGAPADSDPISADVEFALVAGGADIVPAADMTITGARLVIADDYSTATLTLITGDSAIDNIEIDSNEAVEYFNLQGVKVNGELPAGLYIAKQGAKATKVLVK